MDQTLKSEFPNKTLMGENSKFEKSLLFFIPQNTTIFTKEMVRQLVREQRVMRKELEKFDSWFYNIYFNFIGTLGKLKLAEKKLLFK